MKSLTAILFFIVYYVSFAQTYLPLEFQKALKNQTRTTLGIPGQKYWQNKSAYNIRVVFDPASNILNGDEDITYFNNSPDTLKEIVFRIYQDLFKLEAVRDFELSASDLHKGVNILKLEINGKSVDLNSKWVQRQSTVLSIQLDSIGYILPQNKASISFTWSLSFPGTSTVRMGRYDSTSYFCAYWYPQVSVYDDIHGWDKIPYSGQQEFYNDFNDYSVKLILPAGFTVWATGELQNPESLFSNEFLEKYRSAQKSDSVVNLVTLEMLGTNQHLKTQGRAEWHFAAKNVTDFAFAVSDHYLWDAGSVLVEKSTGRRAIVNAAYKKESKDFQKVAWIGLKTLYKMSHEFPGEPYPYPVMTVFNGGGGMEFPMMVNDGSERSWSGIVGLTSHEIAHTYFPFYMGINEKCYAWMDEGWAVMLPYILQKELGQYDPRVRNVRAYSSIAGTQNDVPLIVHSHLLNGMAYRNASYSKPATAYYFLRDYLGEKKFDFALREYFARWNGKHPLPYDFFNSFNESVKEDLSWYWKPWFLEYGYPDLGITGYTKTKNEISVVIKKNGNIPIPVQLNFNFTDNSKDSLYLSAGVWKNTSQHKMKYVVPKGKVVKTVTLGSEIIPDIDRTNNTVEIK